jgi:hypothetical protein
MVYAGGNIITKSTSIDYDNIDNWGWFISWLRREMIRTE